jgi:hypothetical protein
MTTEQYEKRSPYRRRRNGHSLLPSGPGGWSFCSCGATTGPVGTFTMQRKWHRIHRAWEKSLKAETRTPR